MLQENSPEKLWEIPGGRIDVGEEELPLQDILQREIAEELGTKVRVSIGRPCALWTRICPGVPNVFLTGFQCDFVSGEITLSDEHLAYRWVTKEESLHLPLAEGYQTALDQFWKNV